MSLKQKIYEILKGIGYDDLTTAEKQILKLVNPKMENKTKNYLTSIANSN